MKLSKVALIGLLFVVAKVHAQDAAPASDDSPIVTYSDSYEDGSKISDSTTSFDNSPSLGEVAADAASDAGASDAQAAQIQNAIDNEGS
ncbi:unnamed protein product, partial [Aphanomyces euteiches]